MRQMEESRFEVHFKSPIISPPRIVDDVNKCLDAMDKNSEVIITMTEANRSPWFNMVSVNSKNYVDVI